MMRQSYGSLAHGHHRHCGAVLIYVLGVAAVLAGVLAVVQTGNRMSVMRFDALLRDVDVQYTLYSAVNLARSELQKDLGANPTDGPGDTWYRYREEKSFPFEEGELTLRLVDAGALPDLNRLYTASERDVPYRQVLGRYLQGMGMSGVFLDSVRDWTDPDSVRYNQGAEQVTYDGHIPPYRPANAPVLAPADARMIQGYEPEMWPLLHEEVSFLPQMIDVNVNTIDGRYLRALFPNSGGVGKVTSRRVREVYKVLGDFYEDLGVDTTSKAVELGVRSTYFRLDVVARRHDVRRGLSALFMRDSGKTQIRTIKWQ